MHQILPRLVAASFCALLAGCVFTHGDDDENTGEAAAAQIMLGNLNWRQYVFTLNTVPPEELAQVFAIHNTTGAYTAGNEYWYVNRDAAASLGSAGISISYTDHGSGSPSAPSSYAHMQSFVEPANLSWVNMGTSDPIGGGSLHKNSNVYLRLRKDTASPPHLTYVTWYQVLANGSTAANISPSGTFSTASSIGFPRDTSGHYIDFQVP